MERLLARLALPPRHPPQPPAGAGRAAAARSTSARSFRRALAHGGEFLSLARRARAVEEPRLVVLCDTSGSMDPHTRFLLTFVLALRRVARRDRDLRLQHRARAADALRCGPGRIDLTLERLAAEVPDWSGGTRIGECLAEFVARYLDALVDGRRSCSSSATASTAATSRRSPGRCAPSAARARRVLWLNPLAGDPRYEPTARAMAAALPYIDRLLPAHNLESLERLLPLLAA